jgi:hypothetical protein
MIEAPKGAIGQIPEVGSASDRRRKHASRNLLRHSRDSGALAPQVAPPVETL